jgi:hypothetical protein
MANEEVERTIPEPDAGELARALAHYKAHKSDAALKRMPGYRNPYEYFESQLHTQWAEAEEPLRQREGETLKEAQESDFRTREQPARLTVESLTQNP